MTDDQVKHIFNHIVPSINTSYGQTVRGKVIGWKRGSSGALGAIIVFPNSDKPGKHLYMVDPTNWFRLNYERALH